MCTYKVRLIMYHDGHNYRKESTLAIPPAPDMVIETDYVVTTATGYKEYVANMIVERVFAQLGKERTFVRVMPAGTGNLSDLLTPENGWYPMD